MNRKVIADTSFLIDLLRAGRNKRRIAAEGWLERNAGVEIVLTATILGEFVEGFPDTNHAVVEHLMGAHQVLSVNSAVALNYARLSRKLEKAERALGTNDTWIAAAALAYGLPLLTRNSEDFRRINGLTVIDYV